ncbi:MAG: hypothetical protein GY913_18145 [Proteobacteria bacterium]|nr:hypothetical protein [Pseudomonadota bacterium]MCP4918830.1 hypothetical protein [Pseudomonadota bacterium]
MLLVLASVSLAADPTVKVNDAGLTVSTVLASDADTVRAVLDDSNATYALSPDLVSYSVVEKGRCDEITTEAPGLFSNMRMRTLRCRNSDGSISDKLISSDDFDQYDVTWTIKEVDGGVQVVYHLKAELSMPVPDKMLYQRAGDAAENQLKNLVSLLD